MKRKSVLILMSLIALVLILGAIILAYNSIPNYGWFLAVGAILLIGIFDNL
jgi:hypothetical protein